MPGGIYLAGHLEFIKECPGMLIFNKDDNLLN